MSRSSDVEAIEKQLVNGKNREQERRKGSGKKNEGEQKVVE